MQSVTTALIKDTLLQDVCRTCSVGTRRAGTQTAKYYNVNQMVKSNQNEREMAAALISVLAVVTGHKPAAGLL